MTEIRTADGLRWLVAPSSGDYLGPDPHEEQVGRTLLDLLPRPADGRHRVYPDLGGVLLDIGAHVGHYTLRAARMGHRVIAVEANPETAGWLLANVVLNGLDDRVRLIPHPAWDEYESLAWRPVSWTVTRDGSGQVHPDGSGRLWPVVLDDVLGTEPRIDAVKIDTEGAELHVLRGLRATLKRLHPVLWIEDHSWIEGAYSREELFALLDELGYGHIQAGEFAGFAYWLCRPR